MSVHVVGGVYREYCVHPRWNEIYGSAGRAALAIGTLGTPVILHSYFDDESLRIFEEKSVWLNSFRVEKIRIASVVEFEYLYDLAAPNIRGIPSRQHPSLELAEESVVRFGMLDGDSVVHAQWAVYDPQNGHNAQPFRANGSTAKHLALVLNSTEARHLAGMPDASPVDIAPILGRQEGAEVVVVKMGPQGAYVWTPSATEQVPAYKTSRVWKIGSGDCFVAYFANAWMHERRPPVEAAEIASQATAYYCDTQGFPTSADFARFQYEPVEVSDDFRNGAERQVYLAAPFFDLQQVWLVEQARAQLRAMGLQVFSPYHDIGLGSADDVVEKDLEAIRSSHVVLALIDGLDAGSIFEIGFARALSKPVVIYCERHGEEALKMMRGSSCIVRDNFTSAIYSALWEAAKI